MQHGSRVRYLQPKIKKSTRHLDPTTQFSYQYNINEKIHILISVFTIRHIWILIYKPNFKPRSISYFYAQDTDKYELKFTRTERWINPLMGWTSSRDPLSNLSIVFPNKQAAINFAIHNGTSNFIFANYRSYIILQ